jgi:hypothetical protein
LASVEIGYVIIVKKRAAPLCRVFKQAILKKKLLAKACLPGCEEAQKIYAELANRDASYASIPKMEKCDECDQTDYCNDENQHDEF